MELISVVVPVYNAGPYLERCLDSIAAQTYPNWEAILVDDGSTDGGGGICRRRAARDGRFQYAALPDNRGPSAARNEGVGRAAGAFISFVDADDYVEPGLLEALYRNWRETGADICACGNEGMGLEEGPPPSTPRRGRWNAWPGAPPSCGRRGASSTPWGW